MISYKIINDSFPSFLVFFSKVHLSLYILLFILTWLTAMATTIAQHFCNRHTMFNTEFLTRMSIRIKTFFTYCNCHSISKRL